MAITAKVVRMPGAMVEVMLTDDATVGDALAAAGFTLASGEALTLNGATVTTANNVANGNIVVVAKSLKGAA